MESDGAAKKKILGCIFSEKLVLENEKVAATLIPYLYRSSSVPVRFWGVPKKRKRPVESERESEKTETE